MSEIKQLNLPVVQYDPMRGLPKQQSLADNLRQVQERKLRNKMGEYQVQKMKRDNEQYLINKRAENFMFSNYPSSKPKGDFTTAFQNRKFGPGSREVLLKEWKENVGGNFGAFQQWYDAGKKAEDQALFKSFDRNPAKYKSDKAYKKAISDWMNGMPEAEQQQILNDAPPEVRAILNENWDAANEKWYEKLERNLGMGDEDKDDDSWLPEAALVGLGGVGLGILGAKGKVVKKAVDLVTKSGSLKGRALKNVDELTKGSKIEKEIAEKGINRASDYRKFRASQEIPHKAFETLDRDLAKLVQDGGMNRSDAKKFKAVINQLVKSGKEVNAESIGNALKQGGREKYGSLMKSLNSYNKSSIGPIRTTGLLRGMGYGLGTSIAVNQGLQAMGMDEEKAGAWGNAMGALPIATNPAGMYQAIQKLADKKGRGYIMKKIAAKGGVKLLSSLAAKTVLGATGWGAVPAAALLTYDLYTIYDLLKDEMED
tara:strand:- start:1932 stop:3383 length:1452 start_codon:yes stop_codon:yes gene_type:complete